MNGLRRVLAVGDRGRLTPAGPVHRVVRVTPCAAYIKPLYSEPRVIVLPNGRTFRASEGGGVVPVSLHAQLYDFAPGGDADRGGEPATPPASQDPCVCGATQVRS
jgi:hypothetical protein